MTSILVMCYAWCNYARSVKSVMWSGTVMLRYLKYVYNCSWGKAEKIGSKAFCCSLQTQGFAGKKNSTQHAKQADQKTRSFSLIFCNRKRRKPKKSETDQETWFAKFLMERLRDSAVHTLTFFWLELNPKQLSRMHWKTPMFPCLCYSFSLFGDFELEFCKHHTVCSFRWSSSMSKSVSSINF